MKNINKKIILIICGIILMSGNVFAQNDEINKSIITKHANKLMQDPKWSNFNACCNNCWEFIEEVFKYASRTQFKKHK